jgi:hypothetical protein
MRTTLDIDLDVLQAAKELAARDRSTAGKIISDLARQSLTRPTHNPGEDSRYRMINGVPVLPDRSGEVITLDHIRRIMDEEDV